MNNEKIASELVKLAKELNSASSEIGYEPSPKEFRKFYDYVWGFYGKNGLYVLKKGTKYLTIFDLDKATKKLLLPKNKWKWGGGDSVDREAVRDILFKMGYEVESAKRMTALARKELMNHLKDSYRILQQYGDFESNQDFLKVLNRLRSFIRDVERLNF